VTVDIVQVACARASLTLSALLFSQAVHYVVNGGVSPVVLIGNATDKMLATVTGYLITP